MFDILITNGTCYAGDARPGFLADIAIVDGKIAKIGRFEKAEAQTTINAENLSVVPGFIDTHSHSDLVALVEPAIGNKTTQGITTDIIGQDGMSLAPIKPQFINSWKKVMAGLEGNYDIEWDWQSSKEYLEKLDWQDLGPNLAYLVPYGNIRMCTVGLENRPASQNEIGFMCDLLEEGISNGAVGLSTGLIYPPCNYASEEEISEVTKVLAKYGLPFVIHQRSEADDILNSMDEVIRISKKSGCHIHFSHFKIAGKKNASLFESVMRKLDTASREISLSFDQYPYTAGSTTFSVILPPWVHFGGVEKAVIRLSDVAQREKMKKDILQVPVGKGILSRMFNVLGNTIDREGTLSDVQWRSIHNDPPPLARQDGT
jgi:N-acyl-D-amino-acid deacylase